MNLVSDTSCISFICDSHGCTSCAAFGDRRQEIHFSCVPVVLRPTAVQRYQLHSYFSPITLGSPFAQNCMAGSQSHSRSASQNVHANETDDSVIGSIVDVRPDPTVLKMMRLISITDPTARGIWAQGDSDGLASHRRCDFDSPLF